MLVALPGPYLAVLRATCLDPSGTRTCRRHSSDGIARMPSAVDKV